MLKNDTIWRDEREERGKASNYNLTSVDTQ